MIITMIIIISIDLEIEIARMWGMKTQIVPVVIGALGVIKKDIDKQICKIPGNINVTELQKIALLGSAQILRKVLSIVDLSTR